MRKQMMPQFSYWAKYKSHVEVNFFFYVKLKHYLKPQRKQNQVAEDSWCHEGGHDNAVENSAWPTA